MELHKEQKGALQWHPAFFACIRVELADEASQLLFEQEHQLGTKPKEIDVLIIKKKPELQIKKNIGKIFRKHNIVEYKSPTDYLGINDFYRVYGYALFYKADTRITDFIKIEEITVTYVCEKYPHKLMKHLRKRGLKLNWQEKGICYVEGDIFPVQIIVTKYLQEKHNLWLKSLTNNLQDRKRIEELVRIYDKHKDNSLYESVMDIIVRANREKFEEEKGMCKALLELMKDEIEECERIATKRGLERGLEQGLERGLEQGLEKGIQVFVLDYMEEGISPQRIIEKLMRRFQMSKERAEGYVKAAM